MKRDRSYLKELRRIDKMNDFLFLENCNLKKEKQRFIDKNYVLAENYNEVIKKLSSDSAKQKTLFEQEINLRDIEIGNEKLKIINLEKENTELIKLLKINHFLIFICFIILAINWCLK